MYLFKECLQMEAICTKLALQEPHNREQWRAEARMWHQRAGQFVTDTFGDVVMHERSGDRARQPRTIRNFFKLSSY
jgi:hypothetical protein